jgi:hypothetical protein
MAIVRICQLGELDELAELVAELRGTPAEHSPNRAGGVEQQRTGNAATAAPSRAPAPSKKNAEAPVASIAQGLASAVSSAIAAAPQPIVPPTPPPKARAAVSNRANGDVKSSGDTVVNDLFAESVDSPSAGTPAGESVLAQFQRAMAEGGASRAETPTPRKSRREQLAEVAEQPFVRRAMELFDVGPGQFRYTPPEGDAN